MSRIAAQLQRAGTRAGAVAAERAGRAAADALAQGLPGVSVAADGDAVRLTGPGLRRAAHGSRAALADPRLIFAGDTR